MLYPTDAPVAEQKLDDGSILYSYGYDDHKMILYAGIGDEPPEEFSIEKGYVINILGKEINATDIVFATMGNDEE